RPFPRRCAGHAFLSASLCPVDRAGAPTPPAYAKRLSKALTTRAATMTPVRIAMPVGGRDNRTNRHTKRAPAAPPPAPAVDSVATAALEERHAGCFDTGQQGPQRRD